MLIFKIADEASWRQALTDKVYRGSADDLRDGFIHFSTAAQVRATAARHFANRGDLVIAAVDGDRLGATLRWEPSRGGALFPHLYGALSTDAVVWWRPLPLGADGTHVLPAEIV